MEEEYFNYYDDEEVTVLEPPYYMVTYTDDYNYKHLANVKNEDYLTFLEDRYNVTEIETVEK